MSNDLLENEKNKIASNYKRLYKAIEENNTQLALKLLDSFKGEKEMIVNFDANGENNLFYLACRGGNEEIYQALINAGARYEVHNATKSPLCIAVQNGNIKLMKALLTQFPNSVADITGENRSVLHIACINGRNDIIEFLLSTSYRKDCLKKYRLGEWEFETAFDPNHQDNTGQTPLYITCLSGNEYMIEKLLNWRVIATNTQGKDSQLMCPLDLNASCGVIRESALMAAVRGGFVNIVAMLLRSGTEPNVINKNALEDVEDNDSSCNSPLAEAVRQKSEIITELLLRYGAKDTDSSAMKIASLNSDESIMIRLLSRRSFLDLENKLNKTELLAGGNLAETVPSFCNMYDNLFPIHATGINWNFSNCQLTSLKIKWLLLAVQRCNPRLKISSTLNKISLGAITRLDLSHNALTSIPIEIFSMCSLRYLNAAQNKIERLPQPDIARRKLYSASVLEEIFLQDNNLEEILPDIFRLPSLVILDISNNKLEKIPFDMWKTPKLRELNIAFNLLKDLPTTQSTEQPTLFKYTSNESQALSNKTIKNDLIHPNIWSKSLEIIDREANQFFDLHSLSPLRNLNLSNNLFTSIPPALPCLADNLVRLNMSYNSLRSMGHVTSYPAFLRQLDLSHNEISCWPSLATVGSSDPYLACYNTEHSDHHHINENKNKIKQASNLMGESAKNDVYLNLCCHKKHLRLECLKTLILADNLLTKIQLSTDDVTTFSETEDTEWTNIGITKLRLMYPNLSMLDISNNCLKEVPQFIHKLTNLSILNISGNIDITELPPNMGLLYRLWNLNTKGCSLQGYLSAMIESKKFKTMEIIGYLKSIYEDAKPYARMKLMVVGSQGIGKTSILALLRELYPNQNKKILNDHWTKRMGSNVNINPKSKKSYNISTVGVDIGDLVCEERKKNGNSLYGPVTFRTWDFGGQKEYYATHQYFLSKRSLYLVVWRIDEGKNGLVEVLQWLGNIQARAPNSPVIIVGTHQDNVGKVISEKDAIALQQYIRDRFIAVSDSEKIGLPKVMSSIEISCKSNHNVRELGVLIYDTAFSLKSPGSKELMLHQKVPASYLALEDVVESISSFLKQSGSDPVLNYENFKQMVYQEMHYQNFKSFRDQSELNQAVMFLHENGVVLHYNDTTLRDFYFLDPQWLCDMLAQVVTIKEINPFVKSGIMKIDDINHLFKSSSQPNNDRKYILNLLNKFEVALTWDFRTLLIPSLLPLTENDPDNIVMLKLTNKSPKREASVGELAATTDDDILTNYELKVTKSLSRLLLISYFPSGFWSRLMIRILADGQINEIAQNIYNIPIEQMTDLKINHILNTHLHWKLWQTGLELYNGNILVFKLKEILFDCNKLPYRQPGNKFKIKQDGVWADIDLSRSSILEIYFPLFDIVFKNNSTTLTALVDIQHATKLLSLCVDHVDILLEDWYPTLGTRFVHTSEGRFLVTRLVPCPVCVEKTKERYSKASLKVDSADNQSVSELEQRFNGLNHEGSDDKVGQKEDVVVNYSWTIEECILATYDKKILVCPLHGQVSVIDIAPDLMFLDLSKENIIDVNNITKGNLIGRGAFGFVFKAALRNPDDGSIKSVAMKMLQPVQPGLRTGKSALLAYKAALEKWRRDPLQHSCKAYFTARQELSVMLNLKHTNIMSLVGVCIQPLALILDCAPKGALDGIIQQFKRNGARIGPYCFQLIVLQTSRAIEYLHRCHIIYRDLKAENVLVWKFPEPTETDAPHNIVHVKIADYGISRVSLPTGTKGFGGTEGFMAPEIMTHNGEEEYTEKVDCFSFGMFLYELITLRQPFEGNETVKESILEGSRPVFTAREVMFPSYCLDLMVLCWDQQPKIRPSASQIVSIACAPEFTHLIDVVLLPHSDAILVICTPCEAKFQCDASFKLWISIERCIEIITGYSYGWLNYQRNQSSNIIPSKLENNSVRITSMCNVKSNTVWFGDSKGNVHSFNESENICAFSYVLDPAHISAIVSIKCVPGSNWVIAGLDMGRIFVLDSNCYPIKCINAQDNFILTDVCVNSKLYTLTVYTANPKKFEIWCGNANGVMNVYLFDTNSLENKLTTLEHPKTSIAESAVSVLAPSTNYVFSYVSPGCVLYQWDVTRKKITNQLDCLKLVPCSESLGSISIDKSLSVGRCQVTALCVVNSNVYIGTSWGCLIVAESTTLTPITVFRPFEEEVQYIDAIPKDNLIITIGKGYRSLISRFTDMDTTTRNESKEKKINQTHCILWKGEHWTPF